MIAYGPVMNKMWKVNWRKQTKNFKKRALIKPWMKSINSWRTGGNRRIRGECNESRSGDERITEELWTKPCTESIFIYIDRRYLWFIGPKWGRKVNAYEHHYR